MSEKGVREETENLHCAYMRRRRLQRIAIILTQGIILIAALGLWEVGASAGWFNDFLTSQPSKIWALGLRMLRDGSLLHHTTVTFVETMLGFAAGAILGVLVAILLWWSPFVARVLDPYLVVANSTPKIALGPIFYVWLGDSLSVYGMALSISVIVTIMMVYTGFRDVDPNRVKLLRTFGANKGQILRKVVFPASVPTIMSSIKVNISLTLIGVIVGEFISSRAGLGYLIIYGGQVFRMDLVMLSVVVLMIKSALLYVLVHALEVRFLGWKE